MSEEKTPERLLAEALRAKAVQAPVHAPPPLPIPEAEQQPAQEAEEESAENSAETTSGEQDPADPNTEQTTDIAGPKDPAEPDTRPEETGPTSELSTAPVKHESLFADNDASFELLSGHDYHLPSMSTPTTPTSTVPKSRPFVPPPLGALWILLLAVVLGAAAGALAGLLTLR